MSFDCSVVIPNGSTVDRRRKSGEIGLLREVLCARVSYESGRCVRYGQRGLEDMLRYYAPHLNLA